jgi:hypothetical protein
MRAYMTRDVAAKYGPAIAVAITELFDIGLGATVHRRVDAVEIPVVAVEVMRKQGPVT